jgi:hypothetical protein
MVNVARQALWLVGVPLAAFVGGVVGFFPVFTLGLMIPIFLFGPLSLLSGAWLATLCAGWVANLARWGRSRSRLLAILGFSLIGGLLALPLYWGAAWLVGTLYRPPNFAPIGSLYYSPYLAGAIVFVAITSLAVWKLRLPVREGLNRDIWLTLLLLVAVPTSIVGTVFAGCSLTYCGL